MDGTTCINHFYITMVHILEVSEKQLNLEYQNQYKPECAAHNSPIAEEWAHQLISFYEVMSLIVALFLARSRVQAWKEIWSRPFELVLVGTNSFKSKLYQEED